MTEQDERAAPRIAVIVLSYKVRPTLRAAVQSLLAQDVPAEIVVVHSGGGDVRQALEGLNVRLIVSDARLLAGGARNAGIVATTAPVVAFLADDCLAEPGWLAERLKAHDAGAASVASALVCHKPRDPVALAAHLSLFIRRMPRIEAHHALMYGASYQRRLFDAHGLFRDDLEGGEDTEFYRRLPDADQPVWSSEVRTVHIGAETMGAFLGDQFSRGRRTAEAWRTLSAFTNAKVARHVMQRTGFVLEQTPKVTDPEHQLAAKLAAPLIVLANLVYALGALTAPKRRGAG